MTSQGLSVSCDLTGEGVCAMLGALRSRMEATNPSPTLPPRQVLHALRLVLPGQLGAGGVARILEALSRHAPRLYLLELVGGWECTAPDAIGDVRVSGPCDVFPGFAPLRGMLLRVPGRLEAPTLRHVRVTELGPVGRAQLLELVAMAKESPKGLPLLKLNLADCSCSEGRLWGNCRDRAEDALRAAMPQLDFEVENRFLGCDDRYDFGYMPVFSCECERRRDSSAASSGSSRARGGARRVARGGARGAVGKQ